MDLRTRRRALMGSKAQGGGGGHNLPAEYQEVEYIQSSGTQYINTGVKLSNYTITIDYQLMLSSYTTYGTWYIFGAGKSGEMASKSIEFSWSRANAPLGHHLSVRNAHLWGSQSRQSDRNVIEINKSGKLYFNGVQQTLSTQGALYPSALTSVPAFLFASNFGGSPRIDANMYKASMKCFRCTIEDASSGTLKLDLIPCYRVSDDAVGMYDLVSETFKGNSGSGVFTKGGNVS